MKNILVVDDEETVRLTLSEWFAANHPASGFNIVLATDGISAVKALAATKIDLLITDLNMPKMDGFELLAHMNNDYATVPIIVMSAFATPEIIDKVKNLGAARFIPKPFSFDDLEEIDFQKMLEPRANGAKGVVRGISLQSFLQLINIESKTCTLLIKSGNNAGKIFLEKGDLMNAKAGDLEGAEATYEIISWSDEGLTIEIINECPEKEKKIEFTIMHLLMEAARMEDEKSAAETGIGNDEDTVVIAKEKMDTIKKEAAPKPEPVTEKPPEPPAPPSAPEPPPTAAPVAAPPAEAPPAAANATKQIDLSKLDLLKVQSKLKEFSAMDGFAGAVLMTANGEILQVVSTDSSDINLERAGIFANSILSTAQNSTINMKLGNGNNLVQVDTSAGHMVIAGRSGINILLILATSSSLGLAKVMVVKVIDEIGRDINS